MAAAIGTEIRRGTPGDQRWPYAPGVSRARLLNGCLGGALTTPADRTLATALDAADPTWGAAAAITATFVEETLLAGARAGIRQVLQIGNGAPVPTTMPHEQFAAHHRGSTNSIRYIYALEDPVEAALVCEELIASTREPAPVPMDARVVHVADSRLTTILADVRACQALGDQEPLLMLLPLTGLNDAEFRELITHARTALPAGSVIAIAATGFGCTPTAKEILVAKNMGRIYRDAGLSFPLTTWAELEVALRDWRLLEPGIVAQTRWRHQGSLPPAAIPVLLAIATDPRADISAVWQRPSRPRQASLRLVNPNRRSAP
ncbi:SAM-dependent methyltransferase [Crossiella sp. S99.2]|nr:MULTISPECIES: SAM-dependent methyltransferase [unclassified Crossiella]MCK2245223.1 SAM-dependent methyltransferase [Crossiella sp. S99.2]MCK2258855.1 SAM-dependent methyltransferase [Crossiella sp. S99.1]